jgi:hypothetical protein
VLPFRTEGDANATWPPPIEGKRLDVEGNSGLYDFPSVEFQSQIWNHADRGYDLAWYAGFGYVLDPLETIRGLGDRISHEGWSLSGGVRAEGDGDWGRWFANVGATYYPSSDDLNPGGKDQFILIDLRLANRFAPWADGLYPVMEVTYRGNGSDINHFAVIPELLFAPSERFHFKAGVVIGAGNGNQLGGSAQLDILF